MSMQGDPAASMGVTPGTPTGEETLADEMLDGAADGSDTEVPDASDELAGYADDGAGDLEDYEDPSVS